MEKLINAFSIEQAFAYLCEGSKTIEYPKSFVDISNLNNIDKGYIEKILPNLNIAVGICINPPGANPNQNQTQVRDTIIKGDKKWETVYLAVYDRPDGDKVVKNSKSKIKKDCVDVAREASMKENRDIFVLIGKSPNDFPRCSAQVLYKPSPKQTLGTYKFTW
jgi:hypothetical protein